MMTQAIYTTLIYPLLLAAFWILSFSNEKIRQGFKIRKGRPWLTNPGHSGQWIWFHVASGELEYAKPVMRELKRQGQCRILVTYFSPSVAGSLSKTKEVDHFVPMPWDTPWHWNQFLSVFRPRVLAIARTDTWPNMVWQAKKMKIPSVLFSATLPSHSGRYASFWGRVFYGRIVEDLTLVSCVTESDRENFLRLDPRAQISVDGDTRFDQVLFRLAENRPLELALSEPKRVFVAGSTWPEDEKILIPALRPAIEKGLQVLLAPHEPTESHLKLLETQLKICELEYSRYSQRKPAPVILIDRVGILADLYKSASLAFVGGSFKKSVHSVMEPAAAGCLTLIGPYHHNSREALSLKRAGLAREVADESTFTEILLRELALPEGDVQKRKSEIQAFVQAQTGVSSRIADWIKTNTRNSDSLQPQQ